MLKKPETNEEWIDAIKSSMTNNQKPYTTATWMHIETKVPNYTIKRVLNKMAKDGILIKVTVNSNRVWYKIKKQQNDD